ncbi:hypothetical protein Tco_0971888 [Tanacetum coccineum]
MGGRSMGLCDSFATDLQRYSDIFATVLGQRNGSLNGSFGSAGFHQIIDFLNRSHICYALTKKPDVCVSFIKQFWRSVEVSTAENGEVKIIDIDVDEGSLKLNELMNLVTKLSDRIEVLEDDLKKTKKTYSSAYTKLILKVKKLESQIKTGKARRQARVVLSDVVVLEDDSSKQGKKLSDAEVQEKANQEGSEKGRDEVSTAGAKKGTASGEVPIVSTAEVNLSTARQTITYTRRSAEKRSRQDKGKAIMIESEPKKKSKKELEQERLSFAEAIRLEEQMNEEQRAQIARDEEIAR